MHKVNHRNVVRIYNYYAYEDLYAGYILMEYIDGQSLHEALDDYSFLECGPSPDSIFAQLIDGFQYMESQGIVHRDIRNGNLMIDRSGIVKVIDFGLGKTFTPVDASTDSMVAVINRWGVDVLPEEYYEGKYDSQTDMFYLAEFFNRMMRDTNTLQHFSYQSILEKMMSVQRSQRFSSFAEVQDAIVKKDFQLITVGTEDKTIYQAFTNAICKCISCFTEEKAFIQNSTVFIQRLSAAIEKNCFEDEVQNNADLVSTVVLCEYRHFPRVKVPCSILTKFRDWFLSLSSSSKDLVLRNIAAKLSTIKTIPQDDLPF